MSPPTAIHPAQASKTASDIMSREVLMVYEGWSVQRLASFFLKHRIAGAPVIASDHQLVGVVSITDIFHFENMDEDKRREALAACYREQTGAEIASAELEDWHAKAQELCTVHQIMASTVISVAPSASLGEIAAVLIERDIHRVFVTDEADRVIGVITTNDLLRVIAGDRVAAAS